MKKRDLAKFAPRKRRAAAEKQDYCAKTGLGSKQLQLKIAAETPISQGRPKDASGGPSKIHLSGLVLTA